MTPTRKTQSLIVATLTLACLVGIPGMAYARSIGAYAGAPLDGLATTCFQESNGGVVGPSAFGSCGTTPRWAIPLAVDTAKSYTVTFSAHASTSIPINIGCEAFAINGLGVLVSTSSHASTTSTTFTTLTLSSVTVPSGGYLYLACDGMANGGTIGAVNWN
jgi:hypothetical protein